MVVLIWSSIMSVDILFDSPRDQNAMEEVSLESILNWIKNKQLETTAVESDNDSDDEMLEPPDQNLFKETIQKSLSTIRGTVGGFFTYTFDSRNFDHGRFLSLYEQRNTKQADIMEIKRKLTIIKNEMTDDASKTEYMAKRLEKMMTKKRDIVFNPIKFPVAPQLHFTILAYKSKTDNVVGHLTSIFVASSKRYNSIQIQSISFDLNYAQNQIEIPLFLTLFDFCLKNKEKLKIQTIFINGSSPNSTLDLLGFRSEELDSYGDSQVFGQPVNGKHLQHIGLIGEDLMILKKAMEKFN